MGKTIVKIDREAIVAELMGKWDDGLPRLTMEILNDCNEYCKEDTETLILSSYLHSDFEHGVMIWQTPYAKRQYWEIRKAYKDKNPKATFKWVHAARKELNHKWVKQAALLMGGKTG